MIEFHCKCGAAVQASEKQTGKMFKCPKCGIWFQVPEAAMTAGQSPTVTKERPGFCLLLSYGLLACNFTLLAGFILLCLGIYQLFLPSIEGVVNTVIGVGCITQSLVTMGVLKSLLWIIDRHLGTVAPSRD